MVLENIIKELENPTMRLQSIRNQLKSGKDIYGNKLQDVQLHLEEGSYAALKQLAVDYNSTVEEIVWLILEELVDEEND